MADIELVIKVPEEIYKASQIIDVKYEDVIQIPLEVIKNGTPIIGADKVESEKLYTKIKDTSENHGYKENNDNFYPGYLCNEDGSVCR